MKFNNKTGQFIFYGFFIILFVYIVCLAFHFQVNASKSLQKYIHNYELNNGISKNMIEGFRGKDGDSYYDKKSGKFEKKDNTYEIIENKLRSLNQELGGDKGKKEIKEILKNTKKIVNLECTKCMMNMITNNKGGRTINIDGILEDEEDENCYKCKQYTELSDTIENMLANM